MPRFNPEFFDQIFYLYPSVEAAQRGEAAGGTGVFVSVPVPNQSDRFVVYACSNKHVVGASGCSVLRVNRIDGTSDVADGDPSMWAYDAHNDLAVTLVGVNVSVHRIKCLSLDAFVTRDEARDPSGPVGVGQNVFMIGRFINHDGKLINIPSVRFGHISMMPMSIRHPSGYDQESFAVEMLSRPGFSGSPVWAYQSPFDVYIGGEPNAKHQAHSNAMRFIGLNWGFVTDPAEVKEEIVAAQHTAGVSTQKVIRYVSQNTGMNGVVPAWHLRTLLERKDVVEQRTKMVAEEDAKARILSSGTALASAPPAKDANPQHREDFTRLVGAAARKQKQAD